MKENQRLISLISVLESLLSSAESRMSHKKTFWGIEEENEHGSIYEAPGALNEMDIPRIVSSITPIDFEALKDTGKITVGHAWEYVFGKETPSEVKKLREDLIRRARVKEPFSDQEQKWYNTISVDADMF